MFGKDIYWYGVQAISLLETGKLHSPDHSPVFHIVAFLFQIFGVSDESLFVFQVITTVWLIFSLFVARSLFLAAKESQDPIINFFPSDNTQTNANDNRNEDLSISVKKRIGIFYLGLPSILVFVLGFLYPKQSWALGFLILSIGCYFTATIKPKPQVIPTIPFLSSLVFDFRHIISGIFFLFALWFHPMVALFGFGILVFYWIPEKFYPVIFCFAIILPFLLPQNPNGRFYSDKENFPLSAAFALAGFGILWDWAFFIFGKSEPKHKKIRKALAFFGFLLLLPIFHFADIQYRILLSLILVVQIFLVWNRFQILVWTIGTSLWVFTVFTSPHLFRYPYDLMWVPGESMASVPNNGLLVAHHGFCEYYHFQFRKDCLSWEPDDKAISELPEGTEIYRAVYGIRYENLLASKDEKNGPIFSFVQPLGEYQLVLEKDWQRYRLWLEKRNSKLVPIAKSWKNPYRQRPEFIKRKQSYGL
ncbi:hypothetical protein EHQ68_16515 [Leptospira congkakensis]|uniref:Uncharacterized protein n=1 Tax=Leptospira congkakensis TaxID=2484932 RepID=A0A4Z1A0T7_9LEPT|nr:hypothetical protein [Leptospira congkakensis]TGL86888.1 hypothetical protein EHQ68_16515 [Leptospira congkakensis]TGL93568.1 hypothetical protein EHQ69_03515 [Leptospira congkakensis]TGL95024.1 hypothetical protein EHQ70_17280 [Leptospira congkakensis]